MKNYTLKKKLALRQQENAVAHQQRNQIPNLTVGHAMEKDHKEGVPPLEHDPPPDKINSNQSVLETLFHQE
jgi:hypothetical protein